LNTADFDAAIGGPGMTIAKFQTRSCVICRRIEPALKALVARHEGILDLIDVDAEDSPALAERFGIRSAPTLVLFKGGRELSRCDGFQSAGMLREWVGPYLDGG
jgi:thioredoxin 2